MSDLSKIFLEKIKNSKVLETAKDLGINSEIFTNPKISELYSNHEWIVMDNSQVGSVVNAVPDISIADLFIALVSPSNWNSINLPGYLFLIILIASMYS